MASEFETIGEASSGGEAVQLAARYQPDIVLMDLSMPGMNGIEGTRAIVANHPACMVVMLTSHAGSADVVDALEAGASDYVLKDTDPFEILAQLLLVACCVFACPVVMGGWMFVMGRDHQAAKLEREIVASDRVSAQQRRAVTLNPASRGAPELAQHWLTSTAKPGLHAHEPVSEAPRMRPVA